MVRATETFAADFEFDRKDLLGKGAWGEVFRGRQVSLNRPVAIKILKKELTEDADFVKRFRREAETLAKLAAENIVQVYSAGEFQGSHFFIMEFVQGAPLSKFIERQHKFSPQEITYVGISVARAFRAAWNSPAKIVHRDIKPANIMVSVTSSIIAPMRTSSVSVGGDPATYGGESMAVASSNILDATIKVMDFGLAKLVQEGEKDATMVGTVIGTPKYISPEQGMGNPADVRSDIYSLGIVLYEMATGQIPFQGETAVSMIRHHIYDTAVTPSTLNPSIAPGLEAIIMKCVQKDPNKRYQNPNQLLEDLTAFQAQGIPKWSTPPALPDSPATPNNNAVTNTAPTTSTGTTNVIVPPVPEDPTAKEIEALFKKAQELVNENKLDEALELLKQILVKAPQHIQARALMDDVTRKIDEREKLRLVEAFKSDPLAKIENPYNIEQKRFNSTLGLMDENRYSEAKEIINKMIEKEDSLVSPGAIFYLMRMLGREKATNHITEANRLFGQLKNLYQDSEFVALADKLIKDLQLAAEQEAYDRLMDKVNKSSDLEVKEKLLVDFIAANQSNRFLDKVKELLEDIRRQLKDAQVSRYKEMIALAQKQRTDKQFEPAIATLEKARALTSDQTEIDALLAEIELEYLRYRGIEPLTTERDPISKSFLKIRTLKDGAEMVLVPAGEFTMGAEDGQPNEKPSRKANAGVFYIDAYEVTNALFAKFVQESGYRTSAEREGRGWVYSDGALEEITGASWKNPKGLPAPTPAGATADRAVGTQAGDGGIDKIMDHPVVQVSYEDALAYAQWANKRLPKEEEWEKSARGANAAKYPWGDNWLVQGCNYIEIGIEATVAVGKYPSDKSPYGCFDLAGNAAEWTDSVYEQSGGAPVRTIRGGSWINEASYTRTSCRRPGSVPMTRSGFWANYVGFRCVLEPVRQTGTK
ncbi:MAG: SUMF1/EgtB/PvdO family nonheme iron enzyme [Planctomycetes bacterium]|nr:SUMF1/EgtB/PvdO family nonheme iron enzyme [Planctomycetota bacterium]